MNNTTSLALIGFITGFAVDIAKQIYIEDKGSVDLKEAVLLGVGGVVVGGICGKAIDANHETQWSNASSKEQKKIQLWNKASEIPFKNPYKARKDKYGNEIHFDEYGNRTSEGGWEKDHRKPKSKGGHPNHPNNLQPLHWRENVRKRDKYPYRKQD